MRGSLRAMGPPAGVVACYASRRAAAVLGREYTAGARDGHLDRPALGFVTRRSENPREAEELVALLRLAQELPNQHPRRQPGDSRAVAGVAEREEVPREIAVQPDERQAVGRCLMDHVPRPLGL